MQLSRELLNVLPKILTIQGRMIMKRLDRMFFSRNKVREGVKKVISYSSGGKIQLRVFQGLYLIMKFP